jgi:hydroxyacylglutathione hydrolase
MSLELLKFVLGPLENNSYLLFDSSSNKAVVIDPSYDCQPIIEAIQSQKLSLTQLWVTHAHFDHVIGVPIIESTFAGVPQIGLHPDDLGLWRTDAGASSFNLHLSLPRDPDLIFSDRQSLFIGKEQIEVRHVPGHTPGHVIFYAQSIQAAFCGDVIFYHSIGRTDLPGGNFCQLLSGIRSQIFSLPLETRLLCGHGPETTVAEEISHNPFLNEKEMA